MDVRIAGRYKLKKKIGAGSFGDIYECKNYSIFKKLKIFMRVLKKYRRFASKHFTGRLCVNVYFTGCVIISISL